MSVITLNELVFKIGDRFTLGPISFELEHGQLMLLIGSNGAGKTTLFSLIAGLLKPVSGSIMVNGLTDPWAYRKHLSSSFDSSFYNGMLSGMANLKTTCLRRNSSINLARPFIEGFKMNSDINVRMGSYSFGMKRKLDLIAALMVDADIYLFDEPASGLDLEATRYFYKCVDGLLAKGKTVILSTHLTSGYEPEPISVCLLKNGDPRFVSPENEYSQVWLKDLLNVHYELS